MEFSATSLLGCEAHSLRGPFALGTSQDDERAFWPPVIFVAVHPMQPTARFFGKKCRPSYLLHNPVNKSIAVLACGKPRLP